jgi:hypothetical protein
MEPFGPGVFWFCALSLLGQNQNPSRRRDPWFFIGLRARPTASENEVGFFLTFTWGCTRRTRFTPSYHIGGLQRVFENAV